jgi:hypothetical protein
LFKRSQNSIGPNKFSQTKVNRCLAEGRERFRAFLTSSESGGRCAELRPVLSAFCDGEASPEETSALREHLRVCAHCRAAMRAYRAAPGAAAALVPIPIAARPLLERAHDALAGLQARLPGGGVGTEASASQMAAAGGARGAGAAALAKVLAVCAGAAGSAAVCVSAGVVPAPISIDGDRTVAPRVERVAHSPSRPAEAAAAVSAEPQPAPEKPEEAAEPQPVEEPPPAELAASAEVAPPVESTPPPEPPPAPSSAPTASPPATPSAAGEFGP